MSWLNKVKDHVGSGITSSGTLPTLSDEAKKALERSDTLRRIQEQQAMLTNPSVYVSNGGSGGSYMPSILHSTTQTLSYEGMIHMRLNNDPMRDRIYGSGFDYLAATRLSDETMVVFVVNNGKHVTLEDDAGLFPSDTLITQLRLLRK